MPQPWATIAAAAVVITALWVIWQKAVFPALRSLAALVRAVDRASEAIPILLEIAAEFQPNEGTSLRDAINRIEHEVGNTNHRVCRIEKRLNIGD